MNKAYDDPNYIKAAEAKRKAYPHIQAFYKQHVMAMNDKWVASIEKAVKNHPTLALVDVEHLAGQEGIIHRLKQEGFNVKPYKYRLQRANEKIDQSRE